MENLDKVDNPKHDCRLYKFLHISGEIIVSTREEFKTKTGISANPLFGTKKNRYDSTQGWCLYGNFEKIRLHTQHNKVHSFENKDGVVIKATRAEFKSQTGVNTESLFGKKKANSACGWCLTGNSEKIVIAMPRDAMHTFTHTDGTIITATRSEFKAKTGLCVKKLV